MLMTRHFDYCPSASEGDNQSVGSSAPVVSRCFSGGYNVKLYISRGRLAWWLLAFLCCRGYHKCASLSAIFVMRLISLKIGSVSMRMVIGLFIWFFLLRLVDAGYSAERYVDQVDCL